MDESINNIYFLKETISKFKNEIQKFIADPQYANNNAVNIRHSLEDLEKTILNKEKNIAGQILNNNSPSYNPIISKYSTNNKNNIADLIYLNNQGFKGKKTYFSQVLNNLSKSDFLGNTSLSARNNNQQELIKSSIHNFNNIYNYNNRNNNSNNLTGLNLQQQSLNLTASPNSGTRSLMGLGGISNYSLSTARNLNNNTANMQSINNNNNRYEIQPEIRNVSENYYELKYTAKRKALSLENLAAAESNNLNAYCISNNNICASPDRSEVFPHKQICKKQLSEENEKAYFKSTLMLRRLDDTIHDKIQFVEKNFHENKSKQNLIDKHNISRKKLIKIKAKRSAGNINYMDRKKIQKFAFDKRSFFNSVNLDKNKTPVITSDEIERGLLAMINRGVIPKQADLTPAFNRDGHPISFAAGAVLREIYGRNNLKDEVEIENNKSLERIKIVVSNKDKGFFLTAAASASDGETKNAVRTVPPLSKISLFNNVSKKNHKINDEEIKEIDKEKVKELSEFVETRGIAEEKFIDDLNKSQESIEKYNNNEKNKILKNNNEINYNNENTANDLNSNLNSSDLDGISSSYANKNLNDDHDEKAALLMNKSGEMGKTNSNIKYTASYYQTENILHSKINITKSNFGKGTFNNISNNNNNKLDDENNLNQDGNCLSEILRYNKCLTENSHKDEKRIIYTENNHHNNNMNIVDQNDSNIMENMENEVEKPSLINNINNNHCYNISETYTNTDILLILKFKNFCVMQNQDYILFKNENEENWGKINYLINHIQKLFKKLNFTNEEIDTKKLLNLVEDELANITNKDLILLMTDRLLKQRGFANKKVFHLNLKEAFIVRIQNYYRMFNAKKKYLKQKNFVKKVIKIQRTYRLCLLKKMYNILVENKRRDRLNNFRTLMDNFKINWRQNKNGPRIEIHINSYGFNNLKNATFEKFYERQNNQLNRMINLKDRNVEIVYVCPFEIGAEVLSYYFSILSTMGVENAKERFHLVVPVS